MGVIALLIFFLLSFSRPVFAALSLSVEYLPATVFPDQEFSGIVNLSCANCSDSYLRGVFFEEGSNNYFGFTQNDHGDWVNSSNPKTIYYHLPPTESSRSGQLNFKFDPERPAGSYRFKVVRYTSSGSKSGETTSVSINVVGPPTTTPTPTATPTQTTTPSPTSPPPTPTPSKTPPPPKTSPSSPSPSLTTASVSLAPASSISSAILSASDSAVAATESERVTPSLVSETLEKDSMGNLTFIGVLASTIILLFLIYRRLKLLSINAKVK